MRLKIQHVTRFSYPAPVCNNHTEVRLMPINDERQTCTNFSLVTSPLSHVFHYDLPTGRVHHFNVRHEHRQLIVTALSHVITQPSDAIADLPIGGPDLEYYESGEIRQDYAEYLMSTERVPNNLDLDNLIQAARSGSETPDTASFLISLNNVLHRGLTYKKGATDVDTPLQTVIETREGVCQDFAHLMLAICRRVRIPARYTSGYLYTRGVSGSDSDIVDGDAMHAWIECLLPDNRWHGFDPANGVVTGEAFVRVHFGRDYGDVVPMRGVFEGPQARTLDVSVSVGEDDG